MSATNKRVLVCSPVMPAYDRQSGSQRLFDLVEFFRSAGWSVTFASSSGESHGRYAKMLQQRGIATHTNLDRIEETVSFGHFDLAVASFWYLAESVMPIIRASSPETRVMVDSVDLHFVRHSRSTFLDLSGSLDPEYASQMARELNTYAAADGVLTVSQKEADLINDLTGDPDLAHRVPDGEDLTSSALPFEERKGILFVGNFWHPPNAEAVRHLCEEIVPRVDPKVLAEHPVYVVGNGLDDTVRGYGAGLEHVRMIGWVPSIIPYLERARITVVPLLHGAGTKRKLIQALMVGVPSVTTSIGAEGLDLRDGEHALIADDPTDFADSVVRLLGEAKTWERLALRGREHVAGDYSRKAARARLMQVVSAVLAKEPKTGDRVQRNLDLQVFTAERLTFLKNLERDRVLMERELNAIKSSRTWRTLGLYRRLRARSSVAKQVEKLKRRTKGLEKVVRRRLAR